MALALDITAPDVSRVILDLQATEKQIDRALRNTLRRMATWLRTRALSGLSAELQIQQKILRRRLKTFRLKKTGDGHEITVWFGLNEISLIYLGARQTGSGVSAGKHRRQGAFIAKGVNGGKQVFKRKGAKRIAKAGRYIGKMREPLEKQTLDIQDKAQIFIEDRLLGTSEFDSQFMKTFEHELNWQIKK